MVITESSAHKSENYLVVDGRGKEGSSLTKESSSATKESSSATKESKNIKTEITVQA